MLVSCFTITSTELILTVICMDFSPNLKKNMRRKIETDMKLKNRILSILLLTVLIFSLVGCANCIGIEYKDVNVTIVDEYHRSAWSQLVFVGKIITVITHPATWQITVEYNGVEYRNFEKVNFSAREYNFRN